MDSGIFTIFVDGVLLLGMGVGESVGGDMVNSILWQGSRVVCARIEMLVHYLSKQDFVMFFFWLV